jgi:hypothetical protein
MTEYKLALAFLDSSPSFAHGFEAGKLYQQMRDRQPKIENYYQTGNLEQIKLMCQELGYAIVSLNIADDYFWLEIELQEGDR